jgi:hypothetical protein
MAKRLTDKGVDGLARRVARYVVSDPELRGHYVRVSPNGSKVFAAVARGPYGKQVWATLGTTADLNIEDARERARKAIRRITPRLPRIGCGVTSSRRSCVQATSIAGFSIATSCPSGRIAYSLSCGAATLPPSWT